MDTSIILKITSEILANHSELISQYKEIYNAGRSANQTKIGFEANLQALFFMKLHNEGLCPLLEYPYCHGDTTQRCPLLKYLFCLKNPKVDIYLNIDNNPIFIELGMYHSDWKRKYNNDFERLKNGIDVNKSAIGYLIHFNVYNQKKDVREVFAGFTADGYQIDHVTILPNGDVVENFSGGIQGSVEFLEIKKN